MQGIIKRSLVLASLFFVLASSSLSSNEGIQRLFDERWGDHLPDYCMYTQLLPDHSYGLYGSPKSLRTYGPRFGPTWHHLHHYCFGLEATYAATALEDDALRRSKYYEAVTEFDYVLARAPDDFILKPEIYTAKGAALEIIELYGEAVEAYTEAIRVKGDYVPAYIGLSNCLETLGSLDEAIAAIDSGLQIVPGSEVLLERRADLSSRADARRP